MTDLKNSAARIAMIALLSAAPVAVFATETGSPQQAVDADPDEEVSQKEIDGESMEDTARADQGKEAYTDADVEDDVDGSLIESDAKNDD